MMRMNNLSARGKANIRRKREISLLSLSYLLFPPPTLVVVAATAVMRDTRVRLPGVCHKQYLTHVTGIER